MDIMLSRTRGRIRAAKYDCPLAAIRHFVATGLQMFDRFVIAAAVDRLIYGSDTTFNIADARLLLDPCRASRHLGCRLAWLGKCPAGPAAALPRALVTSRSRTKRTGSFSIRRYAYTRAGQWKLMWIGKRTRQFVEIEQVMAEATDDGRGALICYEADAGPPGR